MKKISRRQFLGYTTRAGAAIMFAGIFAPSATSILGMGGISQSS
ncbi:twin-arginine translocation signal domain-containing protein [Kaarinaea lacus]